MPKKRYKYPRKKPLNMEEHKSRFEKKLSPYLHKEKEIVEVEKKFRPTKKYYIDQIRHLKDSAGITNKMKASTMDGFSLKFLRTLYEELKSDFDSSTIKKSISEDVPEFVVPDKIGKAVKISPVSNEKERELLSQYYSYDGYGEYSDNSDDVSGEDSGEDLDDMAEDDYYE